MRRSSGSTIYSDIILLQTVAASQTTVTVYPSPVRTVANVTVRIDKDLRVAFSIFDAQAKLVSSGSADMLAGENVLSLDLEKLSLGYYFIRVQFPDETKTVWFMKE
jgi:hypothetical protein